MRAASYAAVAVCLLAILVALLVMSGISPTRRLPSATEWAGGILGVIVAVGIALRPHWVPAPLQAVAAVVAVMATGWALAAYWVLGRSFAVDAAVSGQHRLRTSGPYSRCRHPAYTGLIGYGAAATIVVNPLLLVVVAAGAVLAARQMTAEEAVLAQRYGESWTQYTARVPRRVIPTLRKRNDAPSVGS